jgi:hypothetical protein
MEDSFMYNHLTKAKWTIAVLLTILVVAFVLASIFGGLFFNLDFKTVLFWFEFVVLAVFALVFVFALIYFICWFLGSRPHNILLLLGVLGIVALFVWLFIGVIGGNGPVIDIMSMF